jgi:metal-dependent hydrolase (beta-lactamase superfamily II)
MALEIVTMQLGPMGNNTYLIADAETHKAVVIDPGFDSEHVLTAAAKRGWLLVEIWLTHAHFDHIAGVNTLANSFSPRCPPRCIQMTFLCGGKAAARACLGSISIRAQSQTGCLRTGKFCAWAVKNCKYGIHPGTLPGMSYSIQLPAKWYFAAT